MPSAAGLITSTFLGLLARRMQVLVVGKQVPRSWSRLTGYGLSTGVFVGGYLVADHFIDNNRALLDRRLQVLREQRAQQDIFHEFDLENDHRLTAEKRRSRFFELFDRFGKSYK